MVLTAYKPAYHAIVPNTSDVKALFLKSYVIEEQARFYSQTISPEEVSVEILSPRTQIDKKTLRSIRLDGVNSKFRRLDDYLSTN